MGVISTWSQVVTASSPMRFEPADGVMLEIRSCSLAPGSAPMVLQVAVGSEDPFAVAHVRPRTPVCHPRARMSEKATVCCSGTGKMLVSGVLLIRPSKREVEEELERQRSKKRARLSTTTAEVSQRPGGAEPSDAAPQSETAAEAAKDTSPEIALIREAAKAEPEKGSTALPEKKSEDGAKSANDAATAAPVIAAESQVTKKPEPANGQKADAAKAAAETSAKKIKDKDKLTKPLTSCTLNSGLQYQVLKTGSGPAAALGRKVEVKYQGYLENGECFDKGSLTFRLGLGEVIAGWDEGVKGMLRGEQRRLLVPPKLAYGLAGAPPAIPPNATLIFEVELLQA